MWIKTLHIHHYRNLTQVALTAHPQLNVIFGNNAQGKTNLLEAIFALAWGKGFHGVAYDAQIAWGAELASVTVEFVQDKDLTSRIQFLLQKNEGKEWEIDGKKSRRASLARQYFRVLTFTPDLTGLFRGTPGSRRRCFDFCLGNQDPFYLQLLRKYEKCLQQRNALLREHCCDETLSSYSEQLATLACQVDLKRRDYLKALMPFFQKRFEQVGQFKVLLNLTYTGQRENLGPYLESLTQNLTQEYALGFTITGPHREDYLLTLAGEPAWEHASQGQHRVLVIALLLAELDLLKTQTGMKPIILLDDLGSELDSLRLKFLIQEMLGAGCQCFLTSAREDLFREFTGKFFSIQEGKLYPA
ncbi:MAG: DNA replication and repair protein RecF [Deltaproteobacteria bacterium]|nr:DNA replication and repair protein RecF [Deltaproteobacteria bacterium]